MTVVEFFDNSSMENIISALVCRPERVVFVGRDSKRIKRAIKRYYRVFRSRGIEIELLHRSPEGNGLESVTEVLEEIFTSYTDCVFDLTGGNDLELVAVGIITERYKPRVKSHRFNLNTGTITDCDLDGRVCGAYPFDLTVEENIIIYGGEPILSDVSDPEKNPNLCEVVKRLWPICRENSSFYNSATSVLSALSRTDDERPTLEVKATSPMLDKELRRVKMKRGGFYAFLRKLEKIGAITITSVESRLCFSYTSTEARRCLTVSGFVLEMTVASRLEELTDDKGEKLYHGTRVGVTIDWNRDDNDTIRTTNEIDVLTMRGSVPVFISCKNGSFDTDELYKLSAVAARFGSLRAKRVLIATGIDGGVKGEHIRSRAESLGVRLIPNAHELKDKELDRILSSLCLG